MFGSPPRAALDLFYRKTPCSGSAAVPSRFTTIDYDTTLLNGISYATRHTYVEQEVKDDTRGKILVEKSSSSSSM